MLLVGYGSTDNRLRVWDRVQQMVCHSYRKHLHQSLLHARRQYSESEQ